MPAKCRTLSMVPSGRDKKIKICTDSSLGCSGHTIPELALQDEWTYLGVKFNSYGPIKQKIDICNYLEKIRRAPLKPQQRLKILRTYLIPRFHHALILGRTLHGELRRADKAIRRAVRGWMRLPADTPNAISTQRFRRGDSVSRHLRA